jgi:CRP-like cAMP-binding protein
MLLSDLPAARLAKSRPPLRTACVSEPAVVRLAALGTFDESARLLLADYVRRRSVIPARRELLVEGSEIKQPRLILSGWAARVRELADGRRQIVSFLLPGDLVGLCGHNRPLATSTVMARSEVAVCPAPYFCSSPGLDKIYAVSGALAEAYLLAHVTRLGWL